MPSVQFYQLLTTPLERALPRLLEKARAGGFTTLMVADSEEYLEHLNELLWTYDPGSFLPHGSAKDGNPQAQPILLSTSMEPVNGATLLMVTNGAAAENPDRFERIIDIFDGNDAQAVANARQRWTLYKNKGFSMSYLKQTSSGGWELKQAA